MTSDLNFDCDTYNNVHLIRVKPNYAVWVESLDEPTSLLVWWADPRVECLTSLQEITRMALLLSIVGVARYL